MNQENPKHSTRHFAPDTERGTVYPKESPWHSPHNFAPDAEREAVRQEAHITHFLPKLHE